MYSVKRGTEKIHPGQNLPDKNPRTKPPDKNPRTKPQDKNTRELRQTPLKTCVDMHLYCILKLRGPRCVTYFRGPRDVWQSVTGESKLVRNSMTYFMGGPHMSSTLSAGILYRFSSIVWHWVLGIALTYLLKVFILTSTCSDRQSLCWASRSDFVVPLACTAIKQHRAFSTVGPSAWNSPPSELHSV